MSGSGDARDVLLGRVVAYAAEHGIAGRSLRELALAVGTSHRMLLYHFRSREGLMAAIVDVVEARHRDLMAALAAETSTPQELMMGLWAAVASPEVRPFVRLFFEVCGLAAQGADGPEKLLERLTSPWLEEGVAAAAAQGFRVDPRTLRIAVAASRGLLLDLLAGADPDEVTASYELLVESVAERIVLPDQAG